MWTYVWRDWIDYSGANKWKAKKGKKGGDLENSHIFMEGPKWIGLVDWWALYGVKLLPLTQAMRD